MIFSQDWQMFALLYKHDETAWLIRVGLHLKI